MFSVVNGATFTIGNIVLNGAGSYITMVSVQASTFVMNDSTILRYILTVASVPVIAIGTNTDLGVGGTFLMNGGLITDVRSDNVVSCWGESITMSGNAAITQNTSYGIYLQGGMLNMAGNARISDNVAARPTMGIRAIANSIVNMGLAVGDAPQISDGRSTNSHGGGVWLEGESILNMNYGASISGNTSTNMGGGVGLNNSTLNMSGDSAISGNTAQNNSSGGVYATARSQATMAGNASVFDNQVTAVNGLGGSVYLHSQGVNTLTMHENASIYGNSANIGGGIYLGFGAVSPVMGVIATDTPSVGDNSAAAYAGGQWHQPVFWN